ncbi:MAG: hypothetical protein U5K75_12025 [Ahrensia sp.]|nr:hypothetical protein [Ahrensia sp.]
MTIDDFCKILEENRISYKRDGLSFCFDRSFVLSSLTTLPEGVSLTDKLAINMRGPTTLARRCFDICWSGD